MSFRRFLGVVLFALAIPIVGTADVKIVEKQHIDAFTMMGHTQPASDTRTVMWLGKGKMRVETGKQVVIIRLDRKKMYIVENNGAVYSVVNLPIDLKKMLPPGMGQQMLEMMKMTATVKKGTETKKIGKWTARRWDITLSSTMAKVRQTWWVTQDLKLDLSDFNDMAAQLTELQPGMKEAAEKFRQVDGFPVVKDTQTEMAMGGGAKMTSHEEVLSVEEGSPPAGTYEPPAGAKAKAFNLMEMMERKR